MRFQDNSITSAKTEPAITNTDTALQTMTLAMKEQSLSITEILMFSRPLRCP